MVHDDDDETRKRKRENCRDAEDMNKFLRYSLLKVRRASREKKPWNSRTSRDLYPPFHAKIKYFFSLPYLARLCACARHEKNLAPETRL